MNTSKYVLPLLISVAVAALAMGVSAFGDEEEKKATSWQKAITQGSMNLQFRYRYEYVDENRDIDSSNASTLKSRFIYHTQHYRGITALLEVDDLTSVGDDNYNSTRNGESDRAVVADPEGTAVNQAWVAYDGIADTTAKYGRQRINLDNQRFVGGVGWRQNEQTYDSISLVNSSIPDLTAFYGYVYRVNRIFGPDDNGPGQPAALVERLDTETHLVNLAYGGLPFGTLSGYYYNLDELEDEGLAALSTETYGVRLAGTRKLNEKVGLDYILEYASQGDNGDNPNSYDVNYYLVEGGVKLQKTSAKVGFEVLEGDVDEGAAFTTPLATLHAFQGWADKFLATPMAGIEDLYVSISASIPKIESTLTVVYHDFQSEDTSQDWGAEWDASLSRKFGKQVTGLLKYANYDADEHSVDTEKLWLQVQVNF